jgi:hypothetical protein
MMMVHKVFGEKANFFKKIPLLMWATLVQWGILAIICNKKKLCQNVT